ncbi:MAG: nucleotidyltransferase domain-containing protein [Symploca sp. SIO2D2]|nr:nucleotidyltransferase domain-containing protein [Symploca sp. SIO2D2]
MDDEKIYQIWTTYSGVPHCSGKRCIIEFTIFGSVLREDFHYDSDIDMLVTFPTEHRLTWVMVQSSPKSLLIMTSNLLGGYLSRSFILS